MFFLGIL